MKFDKRLLKSAWQNATRNLFLTIAATITMVVALLSVSLVLFLNWTAKDAIHNVYQKIDVVAEIHTDFDEDLFDALLVDLKSSPYIVPETVRLISRQEALNTFKQRYKDKARILEFLENLENPLYPSIIARPTTPDKRQHVVALLQGEKYTQVIKEVKTNLYRQERLDKLLSITATIKKVGVVLSTVFLLIAFIIILNTIRLTIYSRQDEIHIMKIVGAPFSEIRNPFLTEGFIYGLLSTIISIALFYPLVSLTTPELLYYFDSDLGILQSQAFKSIVPLFFIQLVIGCGIGVLSSFIATQHELSYKEL